MSVPRPTRSLVPALAAAALLICSAALAGPDKKPAPRPKQVHPAAEIDVQAGFVADGDKPMPAGTYDVVLMMKHAGDRRSYYFELRRPGETEVAATLGDVKVNIMTPRAAAKLLGRPGRERADRHDHAGEEHLPGGEGRRRAAAGGKYREDGPPVVANVVDGEMRFAYRERTDYGSIRVFHASVPLPSQG